MPKSFRLPPTNCIRAEMVKMKVSIDAKKHRKRGMWKRPMWIRMKPLASRFIRYQIAMAMTNGRSKSCATINNVNTKAVISIAMANFNIFI